MILYLSQIMSFFISRSIVFLCTYLIISKYNLKKYKLGFQLYGCVWYDCGYDSFSCGCDGEAHLVVKLNPFWRNVWQNSFC
jgi:hypothetical protein